MNRLPSQAEVRAWLLYDAETGSFVWRRESRPSRPLRGSNAGTTRKSGYVFIKLRRHAQLGAHRLAWVYVFGGIPDGMEIDHIDGNPSNNALSNLRLATSSQQKMNKRVQSNNRSRLKGAFYHAAHKGKKWRSQIKTGKGLVFLGYFHTADEAHAAYKEASVKHFGAFARPA